MAEPFLRCPDGWQRATLEPDARGEVIVGVESGGTPSTRSPEYWDGDVPWLTPKEITGRADGFFVSRTERSITRLGLASSGAKLLPPGAVMLTPRAPVGAVAVNAVPRATNQGFLSFRCGNRLRPLYLAFWLRANKPYLDQVANGSTYPELYLGDLFEFEIAVPPVEVQDRILEWLGALRYAALLGLPLEQSVTDPAELAVVQAQNRRLAELREAVLPLLLSGRFDVAGVT